MLESKVTLDGDWNLTRDQGIDPKDQCRSNAPPKRSRAKFGRERPEFEAVNLTSKFGPDRRRIDQDPG